MEFWLARAMQTACLNESQLSRIHIVERRAGTCLANFNIQDILEIGTIKERWSIPEELEAQAIHANRIKVTMKQKGFIENNKWYGESSTENIHQMDLAILNRPGEIIWDFQGGRKKGSLRQQIEEN